MYNFNTHLIGISAGEFRSLFPPLFLRLLDQPLLSSFDVVVKLLKGFLAISKGKSRLFAQLTQRTLRRGLTRKEQRKSASVHRCDYLFLTIKTLTDLFFRRGGSQMWLADAKGSSAPIV